jgi:hypothetical protein
MRRNHLTISMLLPLLGCSAPFVNPGTDLAFDDSAAGGVDSADTGEETSSDLTVSGFATGATGLPIAGVVVSGGRSSVTTGADGAFTATGPAPLSLAFSAAGRRAATRNYDHDVGNARVGLLPIRAGTSVVASVGGQVVVGEARLSLDPDSLGEGVAAVTFDPLDLQSAGLDALPTGVVSLDGRVATILGAVVVGFAGPAGALVLAAPAELSLPLVGDSVGSTTSILVAGSGGWEVVEPMGTGFGVTFSVSEGGLYAAGRLDDAGCLSGAVVDATGAPAPGARVRAYVRPDSEAPAAFLDEVVAGADGTFCVTGSGGGTSLLVDYTDSMGAVWSSVTVLAATGTDTTCGDCTDAGNIAVAPAGCATGNLYGADGTALPVSPFAWEEGDFVSSEIDGGAASLTFYARAGNNFRLRGPAGYSKAFSVAEGTSVEAGTCTRLGNLQAPAGCVLVDVTDAGVGMAGVSVSTDDGGWTATDADGAACALTEDGTTTFSADWLVGAQPVSLSEVVEVESSAGGCESGSCVAGPSFESPEAGCVAGTVLGEGGVPAAGLTMWSSSFDSTTTGADGSYTLATAGVGTAYVWADGWAASPVTDQAASAGCGSLNLYADAGAVPELIIAQDTDIWRVNSDGSTTALVTGAVVNITDIQVDATADLLLGLLNVYTWSAGLDGSGWGNFGSATDYWSAIRISPDHSTVAMQGYGSTKPEVWVFDTAGGAGLKLSSTAGTDPDGLAYSADGLWIASTRKDGAVEVTPISASRSPVTIAPTSCGQPIWWDIDTIALYCAGDAFLYEMDGSTSVSWLNSGSDERVWAVASTGRVVYSIDNELHMAYSDHSEDVTLHAGGSGTTFARVRVSGDGLWVAAIVKDPFNGTDVLAVPDQAPYTGTWLTATPSETEASIDWAD